MITRFSVSIVILVMLFSGCALTRPTEPYSPVARLTGTLLNNPATSPAAQTEAALNQESLTLEQIKQRALTNNPEIAAARWDISAADARLDAARAAFWPQVSAEGGYQSFIDDQRLIAARYNGEPGLFDSEILRGDLVAKINLYAGGRTTSEAGAVGKLSEAEKKKFIRTRDELIYSVTGVYFSILGQQKILASLEFSRKALEENKKRVTQLYEAQKVARVDLLRTEVRLADLNQTIFKEENTLAIQKHLLFNLMGYDAVPENALFDDTAGFPSETSFDVKQLIDSALKNRPDYQAARDRLEAQTLRVDAAKAGHLPSINLVGTYGVRNAPSPDVVGKNTLSKEDVGSVGVVLSMPLFEGGRVSAKVREESALLSAARDRLRKLELQIRLETETAALDVLSNTERFKATEKSIEQAKESLRIESLKYELGRGSITDILDAQAALLQAETANCRSCIDYHISRARLNLATGGGL